MFSFFFGIQSPPGEYNLLKVRGLGYELSYLLREGAKIGTLRCVQLVYDCIPVNLLESTCHDLEQI